jgi:hypothetical protein
VPGWHDATSQLRESGELDTLGVVIEQHPDRARLFMQWKQFEWPLLWDPFNLLELPAVPITMILDGEGVIRLLQPKLDRAGDVMEFVRNGFEPIETPNVVPSPVPDRSVLVPPSVDDPDVWSDHAVALALWGGPDRMDDAVAASTRGTAGDSDGRSWFRRGVILRMRHDSKHRQGSDFAEATDSWTRALDADPANYVWRRRLQQYGPRLAKPYAFYDWIPLARDEISDRGESPVPLAAEPEGAEFSEPSSGEDRVATESPAPPDPRIVEDTTWIETTVNVVPSRVRPADAVRVHVDLRPGDGTEIHWNNETGPGGFWVEPPAGWAVDPEFQEIEVPPEATSDERRHIEFEVRVPASASTGPHRFEAQTLYAVCDDETGVCMIRRRSIPITVLIDGTVVGLGD